MIYESSSSIGHVGLRLLYIIFTLVVFISSFLSYFIMHLNGHWDIWESGIATISRSGENEPERILWTLGTYAGFFTVVALSISQYQYVVTRRPHEVKRMRRFMTYTAVQSLMMVLTTLTPIYFSPLLHYFCAGSLFLTHYLWLRLAYNTLLPLQPGLESYRHWVRRGLNVYKIGFVSMPVWSILARCMQYFLGKGIFWGFWVTEVMVPAFELLTVFGSVLILISIILGLREAPILHFNFNIIH